MSALRLTVCCIGCKAIKVVGREQRDMPMCERCFMPMLPKKVQA